MKTVVNDISKILFIEDKKFFDAFIDDNLSIVTIHKESILEALEFSMKVEKPSNDDMADSIKLANAILDMLVSKDLIFSEGKKSNPYKDVFFKMACYSRVHTLAKFIHKDTTAYIIGVLKMFKKSDHINSIVDEKYQKYISNIHRSDDFFDLNDSYRKIYNARSISIISFTRGLQITLISNLADIISELNAYLKKQI